MPSAPDRRHLRPCLVGHERRGVPQLVDNLQAEGVKRRHSKPLALSHRHILAKLPRKYRTGQAVHLLRVRGRNRVAIQRVQPLVERGGDLLLVADEGVVFGSGGGRCVW